jgi:hypothetical protein
MSLAEIEEAVDKLSPDELAKLAAHIARRDKVAWDKEIELTSPQEASTRKHSRRSMRKSLNRKDASGRVALRPRS